LLYKSLQYNYEAKHEIFRTFYARKNALSKILSFVNMKQTNAAFEKVKKFIVLSKIKESVVYMLKNKSYAKVYCAY